MTSDNQYHCISAASRKQLDFMQVSPGKAWEYLQGLVPIISVGIATTAMSVVMRVGKTFTIINCSELICFTNSAMSIKGVV